jgi:hypothetical protein
VKAWVKSLIPPFLSLCNPFKTHLTVFAISSSNELLDMTSNTSSNWPVRRNSAAAHDLVVQAVVDYIAPSPLCFLRGLHIQMATSAMIAKPKHADIHFCQCAPGSSNSVRMMSSAAM